MLSSDCKQVYCRAVSCSYAAPRPHFSERALVCFNLKFFLRESLWSALKCGIKNGMNTNDFLQTSHFSKSKHGPLPSSERQVRMFGQAVELYICFPPIHDARSLPSVPSLTYLTCSIPDDHISPRRSALFMARSALRELRDGEPPC